MNVANFASRGVGEIVVSVDQLAFFQGLASPATAELKNQPTGQQSLMGKTTEGGLAIRMIRPTLEG